MITALYALENVVSKVLKPLEVKRMRKKVKNQCYDFFSKVAPLERAGNADIDSALQNVCILRLTRVNQSSQMSAGPADFSKKKRE